MLEQQPTFYRKNNFGTEHFYPANKSAEMICFIAGTKTLNQQTMQLLAAAYEVFFTEVLQSQAEI